MTPKEGMDRRKFLGSAAGAAAFTIVPRSVLGGPGYVPPSDRLTMAVIGCGSQAHREMTGLIFISAPDVDDLRSLFEMFARLLGAHQTDLLQQEDGCNRASHNEHCNPVHARQLTLFRPRRQGWPASAPARRTDGTARRHRKTVTMQLSLGSARVPRAVRGVPPRTADVVTAATEW